MAEEKEAKRRINVQVPAGLFERVETYRFDYRCENRAAAVRELLQYGLEAAADGGTGCKEDKR